jgi:CheY-like chemotaxis protein
LTELALATQLSAEQREYLQMVKSSAEALLGVIDDILDYSKIEAGKLDLEVIDFDLRERLGDTMRMLALRAHARGLELLWHCDSDVPDALVGDPIRLGQILLNLVGNAIKFTSSGEVVVSVALNHRDTEAQRREEEAREDNSSPSSSLCLGASVVQLLFSVRDTGIGIPPEQRDRIFEPFSQADSSTTRRFGGPGLGLTICRQLVALMGGRIWVESEVGRGSTFHFTATFGVRVRTDGPLVLAATALLRDLPVLIVDDNATNRCILTEVVSRWGMTPTTADDGPSALEELRRAAAAGEPFPLVLADVVMPGMDGFALAQEIQQCPDLPRPMLLMLSSADPQRDAASCRQLSIAGYLIKPIKPSELQAALLAVLGTREEKELHPASSDKAAVPVPSRPLHILLAEDNPVNQQLARILLGKQGHRVVVASDGHQALTALQQQTFDVVLMDVQMPAMDGLEATAQIRAAEQQTGRHIPIIAMTAHAMKGDRERCLAAGMDGYVSKPIQPADLFPVLARHTAAPAHREQTSPAHEGAAPELNRAAIVARIGGNPDNLQMLVGLFREEAAELFAQLRAAVAEKQAMALRRSAHSLKGAIGIFAEGAAYRAARALEEMGRSGDFTGAEQGVAELAHELDRLQAALGPLTH